MLPGFLPDSPSENLHIGPAGPRSLCNIRLVGQANRCVLKCGWYPRHAGLRASADRHGQHRPPPPADYGGSPPSPSPLLSEAESPPSAAPAAQRSPPIESSLPLVRFALRRFVRRVACATRYPYCSASLSRGASSSQCNLPAAGWIAAKRVLSSYEFRFPMVLRRRSTSLVSRSMRTSISSWLALRSMFSRRSWIFSSRIFLFSPESRLIELCNSLRKSLFCLRREKIQVKTLPRNPPGKCESEYLHPNAVHRSIGF